MVPHAGTKGGQTKMSDAKLQLEAQRAAGGLLRGPMPGPNYFVEMARGWDFPPIVKTPDQAIAYLDAFRPLFGKDAPIQDAISAGQNQIYEQKIGGPR
jgi:hypothetical protein